MTRLSKLVSRLFFWKVLRIHSKRGSWWKRGGRCALVVTTRCPFDCHYCPMYLYGKVKDYYECSAREWLDFMDRLPQWHSLVYVSGGEPTIYKDIVPLVNGLIERGHFVVMFSNLWRPENLLGIKPSWRFMIVPTFHYVDKAERFNAGVEMLSRYFRVKVQELGTKEVGGWQKPVWEPSWFENTDDTLHFPPDAPKSLKGFIGCAELYRK